VLNSLTSHQGPGFFGSLLILLHEPPLVGLKKHARRAAAWDVLAGRI